MAKRRSSEAKQQDKQSKEQLLAKLKDALERTAASSREVQQVLEEMVGGNPQPPAKKPDRRQKS